MDNIGPEQGSFNNQSEPNQQPENEAKLAQTFESVIALLESKIAKLITSKNLVAAEAKVSLSAALLSFAICLTLVVIVSVIWLLLNAVVGLTLYKMYPSLALVIGSLLLLNSALAVWLFIQLKRIWHRVGFKASASLLLNGD
ncbi:hypothetical protein [Pseudoalteromonas spongiae]|uniref:Phage holin family protein n=1 Tax=Pseudoalteromonas spongiae TaxID=298657 RepID=A0ABU8EXW3_9GAMM